MERYSAFRDERDYDAEVDYRRKRGLLEEVNRSAIEAETEAMELRNAEATLGHDITGEVIIDVQRLPPVPPLPPPRAPGQRGAPVRQPTPPAPPEPPANPPVERGEPPPQPERNQ